ncbi:hypothetical protein EKL30_16555 [Candidimonas sp. SYP-B2681]|uniref:hypothetical protein n=1 Tax=Candidimonas sp. SYP-B2681 TaxID=2497686 RepID=UPI000F87D539|nr:hypothetical protein [Candidimonas sp. SYP-B2681]RTZ40724.1 hypothetical protein EKL30_16555 [Candidimonas sp. SYP-B2681]
MESRSRRAFLTGRRLSQNPWEAFCQRLRSAATGTFFEFEMHEGVGSARLIPKQASDVHHARALCAEYGVLLALDGIQHASRLNEEPVLWVEPGRDMAGCQRLEPGSSKWFVQPGCLLGELEAAGFQQFADLPCHITVAAWLADRTLCDWNAGETFKSGMVHASVLLADGSSVNLGAFGESNQKPLDGLRLQQLVPALFQASVHPDAQLCRQAQHWPGRYRLDALLPAAGHAPNLAQLLLGHGGDLGWIEWVVLDEQLAQPQAERSYADRYSSRQRAQGDAGTCGTNLDARIKALFDPADVFPYPGQDV